MKRSFKVLTVIIAAFGVCAALVLAGCGGRAPEVPEEVVQPGTYDLYELQSPTEPISHESIEMMAALGLTASLELNEDGTGSLVLFGAPVPITWDDENISYQGIKVSYEYKDGTLTLITRDERMVFKKA